MPKIYFETDRLVLRALEKSDLPGLVELLDVWDIARWLSVLPYPYSMKNAQEFHADMEAADLSGNPQFFGLSLKSDDKIIGGIGLHPPRSDSPPLEGERELGYWLGKAYWGRGYMTEAAQHVVIHAFSDPSTTILTAITALDNLASQNVLKKLGFQNLGPAQRDFASLRGDDTVLKWRLARETWETEHPKH